MEFCGQCRQFIRAADNVKDLCAAWEQPTEAKRAACGFFMAKKTLRHARPDSLSKQTKAGLTDV